MSALVAAAVASGSLDELCRVRALVYAAAGQGEPGAAALWAELNAAMQAMREVKP